MIGSLAGAMKLLRTLAWFSAFVIVASGSLLAQTASPNTPPGWKTYVDRVHGFSFAYPPLYKRIRRPDTSVERDEDMSKAAAEGRWVGLRHQRSDGRIDFLLKNDHFNLDRLKDHAPTGEGGPPPAVREGDNTFYGYGAGGGGVEYPDQFFFNFKGKTLYIVFDGPYSGKSPTDETKEIESQMLASFRTFKPAGIR
jgi:hypothetical protein